MVFRRDTMTLMIEGNVLITGGAGTLGRAILETARLEGWPTRFTVYSRDPLKQLQLKRDFPEVACIIGDILDYESLLRAFVGHDVVIHAAANKHILRCEAQPWQAISVNTVGSYNVAWAAINAQVAHVVGISTDKAAYPINAYGATKKLMEHVFFEYHEYSPTEFHLCRYGNVLGSNGSVLQLWQQQKREGAITVTDPAMSRFWLTERQAVGLVEEALRTDFMVVPALSACTMGDMAAWYAAANGVEVREIGGRPGEKRHECLLTGEEAARSLLEDGIFYYHPRHMESKERPYSDRGYWSDDPRQPLDADTLMGMIENVQSPD